MIGHHGYIQVAAIKEMLPLCQPVTGIDVIEWNSVVAKIIAVQQREAFGKFVILFPFADFEGVIIKIPTQAKFDKITIGRFAFILIWTDKCPGYFGVAGFVDIARNRHAKRISQIKGRVGAIKQAGFIFVISAPLWRVIGEGRRSGFDAVGDIGPVKCQSRGCQGGYKGCGRERHRS